MAAFSEIDLNGVKGVLLDLDDTLYPYNECHESAFHKCMSLAHDQYSISGADFGDSWKQARKIVHDTLHGQAASHSRLLYFHKQAELLKGKSDPQYALTMEKVYWDSFLLNMKMTGEAEGFLQKLREQKIQTCLITDLTTQIQMQKWLHLNLGNYIDFLVSSEEAGVEKPDAVIFKLALQKLKLSQEEVIMIGDNPEKDIQGANNMGIKSYLVKANTN